MRHKYKRVEGYNNLERNSQGAIIVRDPNLEKAVRAKAAKAKEKALLQDLLERIERIERELGIK